MFSFSLRLGLWSSLIVVAVAVYLRLQHPLQDIFTSDNSSRTFCFTKGITVQFSTGSAAACFTVKDGVFADVFTPTSDPPPEAHVHHGHAIPGLWDGHGHLQQYGEFLHSVDLFGSSSIADVHERLASYLANHDGVGSKDDWIRGIGWDQMALGGMPTAGQLESDERFRGLYMMLDRVDVHCVWVSQAVLDLLPGDLPDVPGGEIVHDPGMGVFCDNAMDVVMRLWPRPGDTRKTAFLKSAMESLHAVGLVGVHDAGVTPGELRLYKALAGTDDWTLRVYAMIECAERNTFCPDEVAAFADEDGFLSIRSVKLFADGALGSWGSAMLEPYTDRPDTSGSLLVNASTLTHLAKAWSAAGYQVNIHAIGDRANRLAVDALEAALADVCPPGDQETGLWECQSSARRFRVEHAQIIHPADQARMRALGLVPSIQPTHATSDMAYAETRLGHRRTADEAYRMKSLWGLGPVLGSDFPVEPPNPFEGVYAAVTRRSPKEKYTTTTTTTTSAKNGAAANTKEKEGGWYPEEALSLREALTGFTEGPARGAFLEGRAGVIRAGALADWVVLDGPLLGDGEGEIDMEDLRTLRVRETWVGGRCVYAREEDS